MNPKIAVKIAVLLYMIAFIDAAKEYVSSIPRTENEIKDLCQRVTTGVIILKTSTAYGDPQSKTCEDKKYGPPPRGEFDVAYSLEARFVYPTGYTVDGKEQFKVSCCYKQPIMLKRMY